VAAVVVVVMLRCKYKGKYKGKYKEELGIAVEEEGAAERWMEGWVKGRV
jgi:hypothetical protein